MAFVGPGRLMKGLNGPLATEPTFGDKTCPTATLEIGIYKTPH